MLTSLSKSALWPVTLVILAVIGAAAYLASQNVISGAEIVTLLTLILTGAVGLTTVHVAGNVATSAATNAVATPVAPSTGTVGSGTPMPGVSAMPTAS